MYRSFYAIESATIWIVGRWRAIIIFHVKSETYGRWRQTKKAAVSSVEDVLMGCASEWIDRRTVISWTAKMRRMLKRKVQIKYCMQLSRCHHGVSQEPRCLQ